MRRSEGLAQRAAITMVFPVVCLTFPAMYVIILGPAIPAIDNSCNHRNRYYAFHQGMQLGLN
jgi:hypothetical protein